MTVDRNKSHVSFGDVEEGADYAHKDININDINSNSN
eukprot:CAMPEP_0119556474 /NCGR_PEP_ID=MMETSP1352-20130426/8415_1 /TAXON_ID=265584 /ORGANISM="Stauroneis constricta, Strain CCMP1120" /LENGTH=36 /DNA_ID= /DNA_START= /DNA_END= /DNA_ORIENTATION=